MKIKLLNNGGYGGLENVEFPVVMDIDSGLDVDGDAHIAGAELVRIGACERIFPVDDPFRYCFIQGDEFELLEQDDD